MSLIYTLGDIGDVVDCYNLWFFSELVVESLIDFQGKVSQVVNAVGLAFDDLDLVVDPFQFAGVDGVITVG